MAEAKRKADWDIASVNLALLANCHSAKKKFKPEDFNPFSQQNKTEVIWDKELAKKALKSFVKDKPKIKLENKK
jgi:hypothetical protein